MGHTCSTEPTPRRRFCSMAGTEWRRAAPAAAWHAQQHVPSGRVCLHSGPPAPWLAARTADGRRIIERIVHAVRRWSGRHGMARLLYDDRAGSSRKHLLSIPERPTNVATVHGETCETLSPHLSPPPQEEGAGKEQGSWTRILLHRRRDDLLPQGERQRQQEPHIRQRPRPKAEPSRSRRQYHEV